MTQEFEREQRYVVLKVKDVMQRLSEKDILTLARILDEIDAYRKSIGKKSLECVVIESDWPEYEPTWKAIEARVTGAQPAQSVPEDVMRDAERYRYLRGRDDSTAGVGCWLEAGGKACARGWLNGDQLDRAIDCAIEALAAAPEAKP